ncbi:MAG: hypothetical protein MR687_02320 [Spirochaetales bacterium]|nr:hypothetical protein [Spirochaetales bacterium]
MKKKKTFVFFIILAMLVISLLYFFLTPYVEYREPELPSLYSKRLTHPSSSFSFFVGKEGGVLSRIKKPSLIVYSPLSSVSDTDIPTLQWGRGDLEADVSISFSKSDMYKSFLDSNSGRTIGFLYNENDREGENMAESLSSKYPNLVPVPYYDRVSVVNKDEIVGLMDSLWGVIVYNAEESREAWLSTKAKVVMDPVSAASAVSVERVIAITPDWNAIIKGALKGGDISFDYTFTVLEN